MTDTDRPLHLSEQHRTVLGKRKITRCDRAAVPHLWEPFRDAYLAHVRSLKPPEQELWRAFRFCAQMMLALDCTYWAFTWDQILAWRETARAGLTGRSGVYRHQWEACWTEVTATLFFLGVLPYREAVYQQHHSELARKWLGEERVQEIEERFMTVAQAIGYRHDRQVLRRGVSVVLSVLGAAGKTELADLTKADLEDWERQTGRSATVASSGVTMAQRVLAAMGYLQGAVPRTTGGPSRAHFTWGRTAPAIVTTFERFLDDLRSTRRPGTVETYVSVLRRFGDWLGEFDPAVTSIAQVRRRHIEAYKQMVATTTVGEYGNPATVIHAGQRRGQPVSVWHRVRCLSCVKTFFDMIEVLEYPERPGRPLFLRGDITPTDHELPRFIPDGDWHRFVATVEHLTPEAAATLRLSLPFERSRAILAVLLSAGLRAGELCRLDTGCVVAAHDAETSEITFWLRVPVGKLHTDRMIPIQSAPVERIDAWMRKRGPQPLLWDERTGKVRDYLFAWQGSTLSPSSLNELIAAVCTQAGIPRYTSHQFRHTLAVQWRKNGMRLETIGRMLGHKSLQMTLRYAAVMPETVRQEFDTAFAAIDEEHRTTAQVRVHLSPEAHLAASREWRESLWVDLGIGFCGLSAYLPCQNRLACLPCPHFIATKENLPLYARQRDNLIELRMLGKESLPADRKQELTEAVDALDRRVAEMEGAASPMAGR
jgi:integrase